MAIKTSAPCSMVPLVLAVSCLTQSGLSYGEESASEQFVSEQAMDEIVIIGESKLVDTRVTLEGDALRIANTGDFLKYVPGANVNRNGPLTALPQYRGASGDRVNVQVDGMAIEPGGPNAMDAPISYVPGANLKTLSVSRGIASVSAGQQTLGGHVTIVSQQGEFGQGSRFTPHFRLNSLYDSNAEGIHAGLLAYAANDQQKLGLTYSFQDGDNQQFDGNKEVPNSFFRRDHLNAFYGLRVDNTGVDVNLTQFSTEPTGTAALPMDIIYIDGRSAHVSAFTQLNAWEFNVDLGTQSVEHGMDNLSYRTPPNMIMGTTVVPMRRFASAEGEQDQAKLSLSGPFAAGDVTIGTDFSKNIHDTDITDPSNANFFLQNFNNVQVKLNGVFAEWVQVNQGLSVELGLRYNRWRSDSDTVSAMGAPPMVAMNVMPLAMSFNQSDRKREENNIDAVVKLARDLSRQTTLSLGFARKTRAPSYQELYLWVPLQSTGGLADGRNYVGNLNLDGEIAREINIGVDHAGNVVDFSAQLFYRKVDNYIQGTTAINSPLAMQINMISNMMGGKPALQFNNVDASLYGGDIGYHGEFSQHGYFNGTLSYVRGERDDISDDLYRIAPLNHALTLGYRFDEFDISVTSELYAAQHHVSSYNNEQKSAGFGLLNANLRWQPTPELQLVLGVDNLLDKTYARHLNGYNRVANADVPLGSRLPGSGRSVRLGLSYNL